MLFLSIPLSAVEIIALIVVTIITIVVIRFFIHNQRSLKEDLQKTNQLYSRKLSSVDDTPQRKTVEEIVEQAKQVKARLATYEQEEPGRAKSKELPAEESVEDFKATILQQQRLLNGFLKQVEEIESGGKEEMMLENRLLQKEVQSLQEELEEKDLKIEDLEKQSELAGSMNDRIQEVYAELEQLQQKMLLLEKQAGRANNLALELDDTRQEYEQVYKELKRKNEKLQEVLEENERLNAELRLVEEKFAEANLQRQQLQRKTQFLQDLNTDLKTISDTNKKLHSEVRRMGELESMLHMISEERDILLRKQGK